MLKAKLAQSSKVKGKTFGKPHTAESIAEEAQTIKQLKGQSNKELTAQSKDCSKRKAESK